MNLIKRNYGWVTVSLLAIAPLLILYNIIKNEGLSNTGLLYHITGEFAIRWMTAVLTLTPVFILLGVQNLFVRQAMGIATAVWSFLHFIFFIIADGFIETFTQVNYVVGFIAILILIPLFLTSNRKSMKRLKSNWKKLQSYAYLVVFLSLLHVAILDKTWLIYTVVVGLGFIIRIPFVKDKLIGLRQNRTKQKI